MKIGVNLYSLRNYLQNEKDFTKCLLTLKKAGCDYVQFSGSPLSLDIAAKVSKKTKLPIVITHSPYQRITKDLNNLMKDHKKCNCKTIGLGMMPDIKLYTNEVEIKKVIKLLETQAKKMNAKGFKFSFHHHFHEFRKFKNGETIFDYMIKNAKHVNFTLDTYWVQYGGASIIDMVKKLKGRIECVHLKDYMITEELKPCFAPLGDGTINFKEVVKEMKKSGTKYFLIEQDNAAELKDGLNQVIKSIKYAKKYL